MTLLLKNKFLIIFLIIIISISFQKLKAEDDFFTLKNLWGGISKQGGNLLKSSIATFSGTLEKLNRVLDQEINYLREISTKNNQINILDKIDDIRLKVDEVSNLKKKEENASSFTIIAKSKKDYRIKIDDVLAEIEPILFDGAVVNYSSRIRKVRENIILLKNEKVALNEKLLFAPKTGSLLKLSEDEIKEEIIKVEQIIKKSNILIDELEYDLIRKMNTLGIRINRKQVRVMTTRIDGDDLARSFAIFDITKQISNTLEELVVKNSFSGSATIKYYGTYVILGEILGFSQREFITAIEKIYIPALDEIEENIQSSISFAEQSYKEAKNKKNRDIFKLNIEANKFSLNVVSQYRSILIEQRKSLDQALSKTIEQINVSYSTYDTASNSVNLVNLINETQNNFNQIMDMQLPEIIPFESTELETKFQEITNQIFIENND